jgi:hypothetical protein
MKRIALTLTAWILAPASGELAAGEGRIPVFAAPATLAAPGRYVVTRNLAIGAGPLVSVTSDDVELDLNGHDHQFRGDNFLPGPPAFPGCI